MTVVTRFAPSPTGLLHVGGARTALFCWLYARRTGGRFILRIEDTDRERSTAEAVRVILEGMAWLGLDADEGPYYQTQRFDRYREIIRGDDHLNSTPRQMNMLQALGATLPLYAHVPMILGPDGTKLSKRHGAVSVLQYEEEGYLPDALLNYLVRLGWSHGDQEVFTRAEMIAAFDIHDVNKAASAFNPEKLLWLNQQHMVRGEPAALVPHLRAQLRRLGLDSADERLLEGVILAQRERAKTLKEMAQNSRFFFVDRIELEPKAAAKHLGADALPTVARVRERLADMPEWSAATIHAALNELATQLNSGLGQIAQPVRVAVTGTAVSPPIDATLALLGRERTLARLDAVLTKSAPGPA